MGLATDANFQNYHGVLNHAVWSNLQASEILRSLNREFECIKITFQMSSFYILDRRDRITVLGVTSLRDDLVIIENEMS